jgi:hypothetical protein
MPKTSRCDDDFTPEWRKRFSPNQTIQRVRPQETDEYLLNPHKGTTTFQRFNGDPLYEGNRWDDRVAPLEFPPAPKSLHNPRYPDTTIAYCRWIWRVLEPEKGKYRWDIIAGALKAAEERGQTLQLRLQPYASDDLPEWFWELGGVRQRKPTSYKFREPDANHPAYLKHWGEFIRAAGKQFDGHPNLESFDIAYAGPWGEGGGNTTPESAAKFVDVYLKAFKKTQLLSMLGTHGATYAATQPRAIGWRADCLGDVRREGRGVVPDGLNWNHMYDAYPMEIWRNGVQEAWKTAPVTFETCWTVGHWYEQGWDGDWIIDQALLYHVSVFMPKSCYIPEAWADKINEFNKRMGYRFVLRQLMFAMEVKPGQRMRVPVSIDNVGVAPIYRPYRFAYRFRQRHGAAVVQSKQDIRKWMPGKIWFEETIAVPATLRKGPMKIDAGLVDAKTNEPVVQFAIKERREDRWHPMAMVDVG